MSKTSNICFFQNDTDCNIAMQFIACVLGKNISWSALQAIWTFLLKPGKAQDIADNLHTLPKQIRSVREQAKKDLSVRIDYTFAKVEDGSVVERKGESKMELSKYPCPVFKPIKETSYIEIAKVVELHKRMHSGRDCDNLNVSLGNDGVQESN